MLTRGYAGAVGTRPEYATRSFVNWRRLRVAICAPIVFGLAGPVHAQLAGTLSGSVHDQTGAVLAGVTITPYSPRRCCR